MQRPRVFIDIIIFTILEALLMLLMEQLQQSFYLSRAALSLLRFYDNREKVQLIRTDGGSGLARLSGDADLVMLLR